MTPKPKPSTTVELLALRAQKRASWDTGRLERVRGICMAYPETVEVEQFDEPWWKAGSKPFASYGAEALRDGMAFNVSRMDQAQLILDPRFMKTRYIGQHGWTTLTFGKKVDWAEVEELVDIAYRRVALRRMVAVLEERTALAQIAVDIVHGR